MCTYTRNRACTCLYVLLELYCFDVYVYLSLFWFLHPSLLNRVNVASWLPTIIPSGIARSNFSFLTARTFYVCRTCIFTKVGYSNKKGNHICANACCFIQTPTITIGPRVRAVLRTPTRIGHVRTMATLKTTDKKALRTSRARTQCKLSCLNLPSSRIC